MTSHLIEASTYTPNSPYGYTPTEWICALFIVLFSVSGLIHVAELKIYRMWWLAPTAVLANLAEVIGWIGRLWSSHNTHNINPYLMQIVTTIIAPTPLIAANFIILGKIIERMGPKYSRLSPGWYTLVFCSCDLIALIVQAVGGASAATAVSTDGNPENGGHIMLGGIVFQMAALCVYTICASEFFLRYKADKAVRLVKVDNERVDSSGHRGRVDRKLLLMIFGLGFSTICLFIRSVYRTIELSNGWTGRIIRTQVYFNVLDGAMITLASYTLNILHPGYLLGPTNDLSEMQLEDRKKSGDTLLPKSI